MEELTPSQLHLWGFLSPFLSPKFLVCYSTGPTQSFQKQHWDKAAEHFFPSQTSQDLWPWQAIIQSHVETSRVMGSDNVSGVFTRHSNLQMNNQPKAHYKLKVRPPPPHTLMLQHFSLEVMDHVHLNASYFSLAALMVTVHRGRRDGKAGIKMKVCKGNFSSTCYCCNHCHQSQMHR